MAREASPARDRAQAAPTAASDISVYGATPIALGAPAIAMALGGAPAEAAGGTPSGAAGTPGGPTVQTAMLTKSDDGATSPFAAALMTPVVLADAAIVGMAALTAPKPATPEPTAEPANDAPVVAGGSGTPPGLLVPSTPATAMTDETPDRTGSIEASTKAPDVAGIAQPVPADVDAAMGAMGQRVEAIEDMIADIGNRADIIGSDLADRTDAVVGSLGDRAEAIGLNLGEKAEDAIQTVVGTLETRVAAAETEITSLAQEVTGAFPEVDLGPIGGIDPAGGITTLVGMVSAADIFGLPDIGSGTDALTLPTLGSDGGDLLGGFAPADVLLTVSDAHDGALGLLAGLVDDHSG